MGLEIKKIDFEIKSIDEEGIFKGIASPYGNIDLGNDRVMPSISKRNSNKTVPYLWQHDSCEPVGKVKMISGKSGIEIEGKLFLDTNEQGIPLVPNAQKAYILMKNNQLKNSIGYMTIDSEYVTEKGVTIRNLNDIDIMEVSAVTFPMNPLATISSVKNLGGDEEVELKEEFEKFKKEIKEMIDPEEKIKKEKEKFDLLKEEIKKLSPDKKIEIKNILDEKTDIIDPETKAALEELSKSMKKNKENEEE